MGQLRERRGVIRRFDYPPDLVAPGTARGDGGPSAKRARMALPGGERNAAFGRIVSVMEEISGDGMSVAAAGRPDIGEGP